ncbi:hypothetical protein NL676_001288 [Syzygium grande]|nr:hypothetical protein NL676_001288 [Syzygium grande]
MSNGRHGPLFFCSVVGVGVVFLLLLLQLEFVPLLLVDPIPPIFLRRHLPLALSLSLSAFADRDHDRDSSGGGELKFRKISSALNRR